MPVTPKRVGGVFYSAIMFVAVSVLCGLLVAGLALPFAGMAGLASKSAVEELEELPVDLEIPPQAERTTVLLGNGKVLTHFYDENRVYVPLDKIAPAMQQAQIAIEDHRFYEHGAMDPLATVRAFLSNSAGGETAGASSLTQQYVKMVRIERASLNNDPKGVKEAQEQSYARKIQELRYAIALEKKLSKDEILERYLNIAYYGQGAYGVEAAAHVYFNTTAEKLTLSQAAMLAGLVQNPDQVNPVVAERAATERRDVVLNRMAELNIVTKDAADKAKEDEYDRKKVQRPTNGCQSSEYPFLCDYVRRSLLRMPQLGKTVADRERLLRRGGLTIRTKIDPETQDEAQKALNNIISPTDPVISTINIVEPGTGLIVAMAQSRPVMGNDTEKGETYYNYSVTPALGGAEGYQAGSTFKAFALAAALDQGVQMDQRYPAPQTKDFTNYTWQSCDGSFQLDNQWRVSNSTGSAPMMDLAEATARSVNTYYVQLEQRAGLCNTVKMAERTGIDLTTPGQTFDQLSHVPSFVLGPIEVAPLSLAEAYATFAARGVHCDPHIVESVSTRDGKELAVPDGDCKRVMRPEVADGVNKMLEGVMSSTGSRAKIDGGYPQAGKTGTTEEGQAVWFAGFTPELAGVAMIAADKTDPLFKKDSNGNAKRNGIAGLRLETGFWLEGSGGGDAGMKLYKPAMQEALAGRPKTDFVDPPKVITAPKMVEVPSTSGMSTSEIEKKLLSLKLVVNKTRRYDDAPAGTFLGLSPGTGSKVEEGSTVTMVYSAGPKPKPPPPPETSKKPKDDDEDDEKSDKPKDDDEDDEKPKDDETKKPTKEPSKPKKTPR